MKIPLYQVDAFTNVLFGGNPAAVCLLEEWLSDAKMLLIATENNLSETAFVVQEQDSISIRWFTPEIEMDLCGHATLAAAHVLFHHRGLTAERLTFQSQSGALVVHRQEQRLTLDFPSRPPVSAHLPAIISKGMGKAPLEVLKARDYVLVYESEEDVLQLQPDEALLNTINLDPGGIVATAAGKKNDFVSRFFTPQASIFEDPVTGSAHCSLVPYWAQRLGKTSLHALQVSKRGGELWCQLAGDRVLISGEAITYLEGHIYL